MSRTKKLLEIIWHGLETNSTDLAIARLVQAEFPKLSEEGAINMIRIQREQRKLK